MPIFPGAQFIASYDAGRGQRYYIFGSPASFVDLVAYYRTVLKQKGELVYDVPATHEFDVGKFREDTMAFPPGVTIKDFQSDVSQGYPNPKPGATGGSRPSSRSSRTVRSMAPQRIRQFRIPLSKRLDLDRPCDSDAALPIAAVHHAPRHHAQDVRVHDA